MKLNATDLFYWFEKKRAIWNIFIHVPQNVESLFPLWIWYQFVDNEVEYHLYRNQWFRPYNDIIWSSAPLDWEVPISFTLLIHSGAHYLSWFINSWYFFNQKEVMCVLRGAILRDKRQLVEGIYHAFMREKRQVPVFSIDYPLPFH